MSLTSEQLKARQGKLTASQIGILIRGSEEDLMNLWREVSGDPTYQGPNFEDSWPVQLGVHTELLNLNWFAKKHGAISRRGEVVTHPNGWAACTLDGWSDVYEAPVEAKHVIQYKKMNDVLDWYAPQFHWQMYVNGTDKVYASIIVGALEPVVEKINWDHAYGEAIIKRARDFMDCVWNLTPPVKTEPLAAPLHHSEWRKVDMSNSNSWGAAANQWLENKEGASKFEEAKEAIKELMESDVGEAFGHGILAKRAKNGAISIREVKND